MTPYTTRMQGGLSLMLLLSLVVLPTGCSEEKTSDCGCESNPVDTGPDDVFDFDLIDPNSDVGSTAGDGSDNTDAADDVGGSSDGDDASSGDDGATGSSGTDSDVIVVKGQLGDPAVPITTAKADGA